MFVAYGCSAVLALIAGVIVESLDNDNEPVFVAIIVASTSLGLVVPVLRDAGESFSPFGQLVLAGSSLGEFGAILALALFYSGNGTRLSSQLLLLIGFSILVVALAFALTRIERSPRFMDTLVRQEETSAQLGVRLAILVLALFVAFSSELGFEAVLGAFVAGALLRITDPEERLTHERLRSKLEAIGYGFLIPAFFVTSGLQFDADTLARRPESIAMIPVLAVMFLVARGVPALLYRGMYESRRLAAAGLLQATTLSIPVVAVRHRSRAAHDRCRHGSRDHRGRPRHGDRVPGNCADAPLAGVAPRRSGHRRGRRGGRRGGVTPLPGERRARYRPASRSTTGAKSSIAESGTTQ